MFLTSHRFCVNTSQLNFYVFWFHENFNLEFYRKGADKGFMCTKKFRRTEKYDSLKISLLLILFYYKLEISGGQFPFGG